MPDPNPYKNSGFLEGWAKLTAELFIVSHRADRLHRNAELDRQQLALEVLQRKLVPSTPIYKKVELDIMMIKVKKAMP